MEYLALVTALNPFVLALLALVLLCGALDYWMQLK
jgi:hypothetical protein